MTVGPGGPVGAPRVPLRTPHGPYSLLTWRKAPCAASRVLRGRYGRDALVFHAHKEPASVLVGDVRYYNADRIALVGFWAEKLGPSGLNTVRSAIDKARMELVEFVNGRLLMDALLLRVATELGPERFGMAEIAEKQP